jgi:hypothetical protein
MKTHKNSEESAAGWIAHMGELRSTLAALNADERASATRFIVLQLLRGLAAEDSPETRRELLNALTIGCFELQHHVLHNPKYADLIGLRANVPALFPASRKERDQLAQLLHQAGLGAAAILKNTLKKRRLRPEVERAKTFSLIAQTARELSADHVAVGTGLDPTILRPLQELPPLTAATLPQWQASFWVFSCTLDGSEDNLLQSPEWSGHKKALKLKTTSPSTIPRSTLRQVFDRALEQVLKVSGK